jgi:hypothetical protein
MRSLLRGSLGGMGVCEVVGRYEMREKFGRGRKGFRSFGGEAWRFCFCFCFPCARSYGCFSLSYATEIPVFFVFIIGTNIIWFFELGE